MLDYSGLSKRPEVFHSFTGLDVFEFDSLYTKVESKYNEFERQRLSKRRERERERKNEIGAGHPFKLPLKDRLLMLLVFYRLYITTTMLGFLFDLDDSNVCMQGRKQATLNPSSESALHCPRRFTR